MYNALHIDTVLYKEWISYLCLREINRNSSQDLTCKILDVFLSENAFIKSLIIHFSFFFRFSWNIFLKMLILICVHSIYYMCTVRCLLENIYFADYIGRVTFQNQTSFFSNDICTKNSNNDISTTVCDRPFHNSIVTVYSMWCTSILFTSNRLFKWR